MDARQTLVALSCALIACHAGSGSPEGPASVDAAAAGLPDVSVGADSGFGLGSVDRAGHPLTTLLLVPDSLKDEYNAESTFDSSVPRVVEEGLESRLESLDTIALGDGGPDPVDWPIPDGGTHPLLPLFMTDVLLVDTALACTAADGGFAASYLDIEREIYLSGPGHTTCGGRTPSDEVVDETLTLLVLGPAPPAAGRAAASAVSQGVLGPTKSATTTFPYLADPN